MSQSIYQIDRIPARSIYDCLAIESNRIESNELVLRHPNYGIHRRSYHISRTRGLFITSTHKHMLTYVRIMHARTTNETKRNQIMTKIDRVCVCLCIHNTLFCCMLSLPLSCNMLCSPLVDSEMILKRERPLNFPQNRRATAPILYWCRCCLLHNRETPFLGEDLLFFSAVCMCVHKSWIKIHVTLDERIISAILYVSSQLYQLQIKKITTESQSCSKPI